MESDITYQSAQKMEQHKISYRDLYFRLIVCLLAAHMIIMVGEDISSLKAFTILSYYPTLAINYCIALVLAYVVKKITLFLDKHFYWDDNIWLRAVLQFGMGIALVSLISFFLVFLYFKAFGHDVMASSYTKYELPLSVALLTILNLFYVVYYFWIKLNHLVKEKEAFVLKQPAMEKLTIDQVMVYKGTEVTPLPVEEIFFICKVENTLLVYTNNNDQYVTDRSLEELENSLDPQLFHRLNRQLIVHISCCKKYELLDYGRLKVTVEPEPPIPAIVSQRKAPLFRKWIAANTYSDGSNSL